MDMKLAVDFGNLYKELGQKGGAFDFDTGLKLGKIVSALLGYIFPIAGLLLLLYLVYAGFQFMASRGDPKTVQAAQAKLTDALIGFIIIFISYWFVQIIARILNLEAVKTIFG
jgi:hypothetical protein